MTQARLHNQGCWEGPVKDPECASHMAWPADMHSCRGRHGAPPRRPVSLKIGPQIQIQITPYPTPTPTPTPPPLPQGQFGAPRCTSRRFMPHGSALRLTDVHGCLGKRPEWPVFLGWGLRPPSQILSLRVYNMPTVSTIRRPRLLVANRVYKLQTVLMWCTGKRRKRPVVGEGGLRPPSQILSFRVYNMLI